MNQQVAMQARSAEHIGEIISKGTALELMQNFSTAFPKEIGGLPMDASLISKCVQGLSNVAGIRFLYGLETPGDPKSKIILLVPCSLPKSAVPLPNSIIQPEGYFNHRGERIPLKRCWELLYNHAVHFSSYMPDVKFHRITRGIFFGIASLNELISFHPETTTLWYHFGFDILADQPHQQHKAVLYPQVNGVNPDLYMDLGSACPPFCRPTEPFGECKITNAVHRNRQHGSEEELDYYRAYRDLYLLRNPENAPLVEMYYYVSPALVEAISGRPDEAAIYDDLYFNHLRNWNQLIRERKYEEAKQAFELQMDSMVKKYL